MRPLTLLLLAGLLYALPLQAAAAPIEGYRDHNAMLAELQQIATDPRAELIEIGRTAGDRSILVLHVSGGPALRSATGEDMPRPALAVFGNVQASNLAAREVCLDLARMVLDSLDDDEQLQAFMQQHDFYFIPCPSPDATEFFFTDGSYERDTNGTPTDEDRDGWVDEDPGEDLNGDGMLTMMRIADPAGDWMEHPDDPRVLIRADRSKNEQGSWRLLSEGRDNDEDESFNEDGPGGVDFNRNLTFNHDPFAAGSGAWPVSEPESRAVVDWVFDNPQVCMVLSFGPQDNIRKPWNNDHGKLRHESAERDDIGILEWISGEAGDLIGKDDFPGSTDVRGGFVDWVYFHTGAWSLCARPWWVPKYEAPEPEEGEEQPEKSDEKRGSDELNALQWFAAEGIDAFVEWTGVSHPDFPDETVEVGGWMPYKRDNPPAEMLEGISASQFGMLKMLTGLFPEVAVREVEVDDLGEGLYRVTAHVANNGYLPTSSRKRDAIRRDYQLNIAIELPAGASLLNGALRGRLGRIGGGGEEDSFSWLVVAPNGGTASITVASMTVGSAQASVELGSGE